MSHLRVFNRLPAATVGVMCMCSVKKGKPELRKKVMPGVVIRYQALPATSQGRWKAYVRVGGRDSFAGTSFCRRASWLQRQKGVRDALIQEPLFGGCSALACVAPRFSQCNAAL